YMSLSYPGSSLFPYTTLFRSHVVASMVCFRNGVPDKDNYRRYRVRTVEGQDDFASMAEVVRRRYSRILLEAREANPDLVEYSQEDRKSTRLNSSHLGISYAVF